MTRGEGREGKRRRRKDKRCLGWASRFPSVIELLRGWVGRVTGQGSAAQVVGTGHSRLGKFLKAGGV